MRELVHPVSSKDNQAASSIVKGSCAKYKKFKNRYNNGYNNV